MLRGDGLHKETGDLYRFLIVGKKHFKNKLFLIFLAMIINKQMKK